MKNQNEDNSIAKNEKYYVYILLCENNAYYTGITNNLTKRLSNHKKGRGAKYTKFFKVQSLITAWIVDNKKIALSLEHSIKSVDKKKKNEFINNTKLLKNYYYSKRSLLIHLRKISKENIKKINNELSRN